MLVPKDAAIAVKFVTPVICGELLCCAIFVKDFVVKCHLRINCLGYSSSSEYLKKCYTDLLERFCSFAENNMARWRN